MVWADVMQEGRKRVRVQAHKTATTISVHSTFLQIISNMYEVKSYIPELVGTDHSIFLHNRHPFHDCLKVHQNKYSL